MPVATAQKVEALRVDFRSAARVADLLGVSRSQVTRWLRGAGIDPLNAEKVDLLELAGRILLRLNNPEPPLPCLFGAIPLLAAPPPTALIRPDPAGEWMRRTRPERPAMSG